MKGSLQHRGKRSATRPHAVRRDATAAAHLPSFAGMERIAERIVELSSADETEVTIDAGADALTRFANNAIHQHVAELGVSISVRAVVGGRTARVTTNKTDEDSLHRVAASSLSLARSQPKNPGLLPMPGPQKYPRVKRFFDETAAASAEDRARVVKQITTACARAGQTAAGTFSSGAFRSLLANSRGLCARYEHTRTEFSITVMEENSSGWAKANAARWSDVDPLALAARAREKAEASRKPKEIAPGKYTVILEPSAALDLIGFLFYDFSATAVADRRSCLTQRVGKKLFGENITLWDDVTHPLQIGIPFDGEGMPRQRVCLIDRGVVRNLVYSRAAAKHAGKKPTGHGLALPNEWGEAPFHLVMEGGKSSLAEMIAGTERGIYVTRLWYIREVDPYEKIMTGMTRDGTFLIENGRLAGGIRNLRFNQSILELLANVEALGPAERASGEEAFDMVIPPMKVRDFHFTEVTKF
jgi:predicted Zn-dependent protease